MSVVVTVGVRCLPQERDSEARRSWCNKIVAGRYPPATHGQRSSARSDTSALIPRVRGWSLTARKFPMIWLNDCRPASPCRAVFGRLSEPRRGFQGTTLPAALLGLLPIRGSGRGRHDGRSVWPAARESGDCGRSWFHLWLPFKGLRARGAMECSPLAVVRAAVRTPSSARFAE